MLLAFGFTSSVQPQAMADADEDFCVSYKKSDAQLNKLYQKILVEYRKDKLFISKFRIAQRTWVAFRNAHVQEIFPEPDLVRAYGTINLPCRCEAMNELTQTRIQQLKKWVDGVEEGEVCAGSIKIKESK